MKKQLRAQKIRAKKIRAQIIEKIKNRNKWMERKFMAILRDI